MVGFGPADVPPTAAVKFVGAGTAACIADLFTFPLDTAKVRLQVNLNKLFIGKELQWTFWVLYLLYKKTETKKQKKQGNSPLGVLHKRPRKGNILGSANQNVGWDQAQ